MSDSFADLWASTTPSKPPTLASTSRLNPNTTTTSTSTSTSTPPPPKPNPNPAYGKPDLFALLSSSSSSGGSSTPRHGAGSSSGRSTPSMLGAQRTGSAASTRGGGAGGGSDAFSDLFAGSTTASVSVNGGKNMTLAARLALEKQQQQQQQSNAGRSNAAGGGNANSGVWVGLDSLGSGLGGRNPSHHHKPVQNDEEDNDWGLGDFGAASKSSVQPMKKTTETLWDLDEFSSSSTATNVSLTPSARSNPPTTKTTNTNTLWDLDDLASTTTSSAPPAPKATPNTTTTTQQSSKSKTLWDLEGFTSSSSPSHTPPPPPVSHSLHPAAPQSSRSSSSSNSRNQASGSSYKASDANDSSSTGSNKAPNGKNKSSNGFDNPDEAFDFGTREDRGLLDLDDDDDGDNGMSLRNGKGNGVSSNQRQEAEEDDDILGMLSKPVDVVRASTRKKTPPPGPSSQPRTHINASTTQRPPSPPPHILGQIVEMGFSVSQARKALSTTKDGMDVQAALENLLNGGGGGDEERERESHHPPPPPPPQRRVPPLTREEAPPHRAAPRGYKERERERMRAQRGESTAATTTGDTISVSEIQLHADKLVSQASEIGLSVFSKASAFWKEGKGKVVRAYEERVAGAGENESESRGGTGRGRVVDGSGRGKDGRPKWMTHEVNMEDGDEVEGPFVDRVGGDAKEAPVRAPPSSSTAVVVEEEVDLFFSSSNSIPNSKPTSTPQPPPRTRTLPPTTQARTLNLPTASPTTLSTAHTHKTSGTQAFKLGQYASACDAYSLAISILPPQHLLLLPLCTNRALARLKTGEYAGAVEDCSLALGIVAAGDPSLSEEGEKRDGGWTHPQGLGVDLRDQHVKALKRRALALEGREKWEEAGKDWEVVAGMRVEEKTRGEAVLGAGRCRKMCAGGTTTTAAGVDTSRSVSAAGVKLRPKAKSFPSTSSSSSSTQTPSAALTALQTQNAQAEADLTLQHSLKDTVDARLNAWRKGKESNIRALLASLDLVLWEDLLRGNGGGGKVGGIGMAELVSPGQVKKAYVRAIGKVHPDKLNASNATVEQRMLANGVFGTLNEAWIAFQAGQK